MSSATMQVLIDHHVQTFLSTPRKMQIGGRWVDAASGKTFSTYNPATGAVLAQVAEGNSTDVNRAVQAARAAFESGPWRRLTASERGWMIWKFADLLESHLEEFAQIESLDNGKPVSVAVPQIYPWLSTFSDTWPAGQLKLRATRFQSLFPILREPNISPIPCMSRSVLWFRLSPGISRSSWLRGNLVPPWLPVVQSCSSRQSKHPCLPCGLVN